tara:strand:- start:6 stop:161 length:156 start_codon:yes stop_codon:yes gene_type:complete
VYSTLYVVPPLPPVISPVSISIVSDPEGRGLNEKLPPDVTTALAEFEEPAQ